MNVLNFVQFFRSLSLCDKARVALNRPQVKGMAGSKRDKEYEEDICEHLSIYIYFFFLRLHSFTKDIQQSGRYLKESGLLLGSESEIRCMYHAYSNPFFPRDHTTVRQPV